MVSGLNLLSYHEILNSTTYQSWNFTFVPVIATLVPFTNVPVSTCYIALILGYKCTASHNWSFFFFFFLLTPILPALNPVSGTQYLLHKY